MPQARTNDALVSALTEAGVLRTPALVRAFRQVDRTHFVPPELADEAYGDYPLPLGFGQTISQPSTVAFMLELAGPKAGERVLEVGSGSGYVLALLACAVGHKGSVRGMELLPQLVRRAEQNLARAKVTGVSLEIGDGSRATGGPYDAIIVSAAAATLPQHLQSQLAKGGRLVVPVGTGYQDVVRIERTGGRFRETRYPGFQFVPLIAD